MEPADYRRTSYEASRAMAPGWERWRDVTQFVGVIPPGRAPTPSHSYDEIV